MSIYAIIVFSIGVAICVYGILLKVIEMTAKKTIEIYINKSKTLHKSV